MKFIKDFFIKRAVFKERLEALEKKNNFYGERRSEGEILDYQIKKFNEVWNRSVKEISFYGKWQKEHGLPSEIGSVGELDKFPPLTKKDIQTNRDLIFSDFPGCGTILTGGSTGEPAAFPTGRIGMIDNYANTYMARGWWEIEPLDRILLLWGHSHLFGSGIRGKLKQYKRVMADWLINTKRLNAYDMSVETIGKYYDIFFKSNPAVLLGYTSTIYKLARYIKDNQLEIGDKSRLKGVIATSETITKADVDLMREIFKVPVIIEYGLAETGSVAYSKEETDNIVIFWDSFLARKDGENVLHLTNIGEKMFPLVNYRTDDVVSVGKEYNSSILSLKEIKGRTKDILKIRKINGGCLELSGILMVHVLKGHPNIYGISFKQLEGDCVELGFVSDKNLDEKDIKEYFMREITKDHEELDPAAVTIKRVKEIKKTISGKEN